MKHWTIFTAWQPTLTRPAKAWTTSKRRRMSRHTRGVAGCPLSTTPWSSRKPFSNSTSSWTPIRSWRRGSCRGTRSSTREKTKKHRGTPKIRTATTIQRDPRMTSFSKTSPSQTQLPNSHLYRLITSRVQASRCSCRPYPI